MGHLKAQYPKFLILDLFCPHLDHKPACHLESIQSPQPLLSKTRKTEHSIFEVILPLPLEKKNASTKDFFFNRETQ